MASCDTPFSYALTIIGSVSGWNWRDRCALNLRILERQVEDRVTRLPASLHLQTSGEGSSPHRQLHYVRSGERSLRF